MCRFVLFFIPFVVLVFCTYIQNESYALSPSFPIQQILDNTNDWNSLNSCKPYEFDKPNFPSDIKAGSYESDGRYLNATLWLVSPLGDPPQNLTSREFDILVDVKSAYDSKTTDYGSGIIWNSSKNNWTKELTEYSATGDEWRYLERTPNQTGFFEEGGKYVSLSLDLKSIGSPKEYKIIFQAADKFAKNNSSCEFLDVTDFFPVPPPQYNITVSQNSLFLRKGQQDTLELQMKSDAGFNSYSNLSWNKLQGLDVELSPTELSLPPNGITTSLIRIKALDSAAVGPYTLSITSSIEPKENLSSGSAELEGVVHHEVEHVTIPITVVVEEPLGILDYVNSALSAWGAPIKEFFAIVATIGSAGVFGWLVNRFRQKRKKEKHEVH